MESTAYVDELIKEYLLFRGYVKTYTTFSNEKANDRTGTPEVEPIADALLSAVRNLELSTFQALWSSLESRFFTHLTTGSGSGGSGGGGVLQSANGGAATAHAGWGPTIRLMETSLQRAFLVKAAKIGQKQKLFEFFEFYAERLTRPGGSGAAAVGAAVAATVRASDAANHSAANASNASGGSSGSGATASASALLHASQQQQLQLQLHNDWEPWFSLPYIKDPRAHPHFEPYFSKKWFGTLAISLKNFLSAVFEQLPLPKLLAFNIERVERKAALSELRALRAENDKLRTALLGAQHHLDKLRESGYRVFPRTLSTTAAAADADPHVAAGGFAGGAGVSNTAASAAAAEAKSAAQAAGAGSGSVVKASVDGSSGARGPNATGDDSDAPFVVMSQEVLLGHTAPVTQARFSSDGGKIATAARDGSLRIWNLVDASAPAVVGSGAARSSLIAATTGGAGSATAHANALKTATGAASAAAQAQAQPQPQPSSQQQAAAGSAVLHATYHNANSEISCLDWDRRSNDQFLLFGTGGPNPLPAAAGATVGDSAGSSSGGAKVKVYNVNSRRVIAEFDVGAAADTPATAPSATGTAAGAVAAAVALAEHNTFNRVLDVAASPTDPLFVCAVASKYHDTVNGGRGLLESWSLQTGKRVQSFRIESNLVKSSGSGGGLGLNGGAQVNCVVYNHNGNMLVSGASDGMIRVFDVGKTDVPIMGWFAHGHGAGGAVAGGTDAASSCTQVSSVRFSADETSIISTGLDGLVAEWSLHRVGKLVRSYKIPQPNAFLSGRSGAVPGASGVTRCELAVDADAEYLLLSGSAATSWASLYAVASGRAAPVQYLLGHAAQVLTVDWHPAAYQVVTGSADHTARVTTLQRKASHTPLTKHLPHGSTHGAAAMHQTPTKAPAPSTPVAAAAAAPLPATTPAPAPAPAPAKKSLFG